MSMESDELENIPSKYLPANDLPSLNKQVGKSQRQEGVRINEDFQGLFNPPGSEFYTHRASRRPVSVFFNGKVFDAHYTFESTQDRSQQKISFSAALKEEFQNVFPEDKGQFTIQLGNDVNHFLFTCNAKDSKVFSGSMTKPPQKLIDGFYDWFNNDQHKGFEDHYLAELTHDNLESMSQEELVAFFVEFAGEGGKIQSGGHRNKNNLKATILGKYDEFRTFILSAFLPDLNVSEWLSQSEGFKSFGRGLATIFLNRVNKDRYAIVNNKTGDALDLLGVKLPSDFVKRYDAVKSAQEQLIDWFPEFENLYRTDAFNHYLIGTEEGKQLASELLNGSSTGRRYWVCAMGEGAMYWDECKEKNISVFGFDELRPLSEYKSKKEVSEAITEATGRGNPYNDALAGWQIVNDIKVGDILISKKGRSTYLGYGVVSGDYYYDSSRSSYCNIIPVEWKNTGEWEEDSGKIVLKTLTDVTKYKDYVQKLINLMSIETTTSDSSISAPKEVDLPKNLILYGPPGTGKTHKLRDQYFSQFTDQKKRKTKDDFAEDLAAGSGWWEIIAMVMLDLQKASVTEIMAHPLLAAKTKKMQNKFPRAAVWAQLQSHTKNECPHVNYAKRFEPLVFWKDEKSIWSVDMALVESDLKEANEKLQTYLNFTEEETTEKRYMFTTFHQSYSYEEFVEGIKPRLGEDVEEAAGDVSYEIKPGVFKQIVGQANRDPDRPYAIFIDEISRGNVASIFGELITLIEDDKRQGAENEMSAILPYSREEFFVPNNLYIIGTMNTADRSVIALDNALRRRFSFEEMMPVYDAIEQHGALDVDLQKLLETINGRIERLLDRDHVIGHSYFMGIVKSVNPLSSLQSVFANKVLPLLQEYFYGDPGKIGMVLGKAFVKVEGNGTPFAQGVWQDDVFEDGQVLRFTSPHLLNEADFRSVYEA